MPPMTSVTLDDIELQYESYNLPQTTVLELPGTHDVHGPVNAVFQFASVLDDSSGRPLDKSVLDESTWDYDNYKIYDYIRCRVPGEHPEYGRVKQSFELSRIEQQETGDLLTEF